MTRAGHTDCCSRSRTPVSLHPATGAVPAQTFFFKKSSTQHSTHSGSGVRTKEDWQGGHGFSHGMRNKAPSDTRAGLRHHLFDKGLCHPPASHAPLPGARSKLTVHLVQGRHRASQQAPSLSARGRSGHASTAPRFSTLPPRPIIFKPCS